MKLLLPLILMILPAFGETIANDHFSKAVPLNSKLPVQITGTLATVSRASLATRQEGEPRHAKKAGFGSVWYSWKPARSERVQILARSETVGVILAVYTGSSVRNLKLVQRYDTFAYPAFSRRRTEPFTVGAQVEFNASANTTYYLAIDSDNRILDPFSLSIKPYTNPLKPELELIKPSARWEYLLPRTRDGVAFDPEVLDKDFDSTWQYPEKYDGPEFSRPSAMPIGYGDLALGKVKTNFGGKKGYKPKNGRRYTCYLRKTFTPPMNITDIGFEGIIDDGAIIYINGTEVTRMNVDPKVDANDWKALAYDGSQGIQASEFTVQYAIVRGLNLPADKPATIAISLHNAKGTSSDLGINLRVYAIEPEKKK